MVIPVGVPQFAGEVVGVRRAGGGDHVSEGTVTLEGEPDHMAAAGVHLAVVEAGGLVSEPAGQRLGYSAEPTVVGNRDRHRHVCTRVHRRRGEGPRGIGAARRRLSSRCRCGRWGGGVTRSSGLDGNPGVAADVMVFPVGVPQHSGEVVGTGRVRRGDHVGEGAVTLQGEPDLLATAGVHLAVVEAGGFVSEPVGQGFGDPTEASIVGCVDGDRHVRARVDRRRREGSRGTWALLRGCWQYAHQGHCHHGERDSNSGDCVVEHVMPPSFGHEVAHD